MRACFKFYFFLVLCSSIVPIVADCSSDCIVECVSACASPCSYTSCSGCIENPHSSLRFRSQGSNTARELVGWQRLINDIDIYDQDKSVYGVFTTAFEYQRSFDSCAISNYLFGTDTINFAGSQVPNRDNNGCLVVADHFGLATDFVGKLSIKPVIDNFIIDTQLYVDLNFILCGLFFKMNAPIVHSRWDLGLRDCSQNLAIPPTAFPGGYMGIDVLSPDYDQFTQNYEYCSSIQSIPALSTLRDGLSGQTFGEMGTPWQFGRFPFCPQGITRLADIDLELGYDLLCSDWGRLALYGLVTAPTGNKPCAQALFSPVVGNEQHWEVGAGILGYVNLIGCNNYNLSIYFEGNVSHLFTNHQTRSFDFKQNGPLSRYMLLKQLGKMVLVNDSVADLVIEAPPLTPTFGYEQNLYAGNLINAINFATRRASVSVPVRGDFTAKLAFTAYNSTLDLGYNIYGNSKEKVCIDCQTPCSIDRRRYALKGTTGTHSIAACAGQEVCGTLSPILPITLNASQSNANIFNGTVDASLVDNGLALRAQDTGDTIVGTYRYEDLPTDGLGLPATGLVTNQIARLSVGSCDNVPPVLPGLGEFGLAWYDQIAPTEPVTDTDSVAYMSQNPVLVSVQDLDVDSATAPRQITHKFFGHLFYTWQESRFTPFIGIGGEIEWAINNCNTFGVNQWGILCKGGISF